MKQSHSLLIANLLFVIILLSSCQKENPGVVDPAVASAASGKQPIDPGFVENDLVLYWNQQTAVVLGVGMPQPFRTRYWAIIQIAVHDALNNIKPKYGRYALQDRSQHADPGAAVTSAAYEAITGLNRQGNFPVQYWRDSCLQTIEDGAAKAAGIELGKKAAAAVLANRANDGFTQVIPFSPFPPNGVNPGEYRSTLTAINWVPTTTLSPGRNAPNWGLVMQPYVIESNTQFRPAAPYAVSSAAYSRDYLESKTKGARIKGVRSAEEEAIALFWSDNRPSVLWNDMARKALGDKKADAWKTARLLALLHVSLADCITAALEANYHYYFWRPETAIRLGDADGNEQTVGEATWLPFLSEIPTSVSPPVPGYPNGAAAYGGAVAEILRRYFGTDETQVALVSVNINPAVPALITIRHISSFSQAATESTLRNIYAGWDFRASALAGEEMGRQIGAYVFNHAFREE